MNASHLDTHHNLEWNKITTELLIQAIIDYWSCWSRSYNIQSDVCSKVSCVHTELDQKFVHAAGFFNIHEPSEWHCPHYMWSNNSRDKEVKRRSGNEWHPREACPHVYVV